MKIVRKGQIWYDDMLDELFVIEVAYSKGSYCICSLDAKRTRHFWGYKKNIAKLAKYIGTI